MCWTYPGRRPRAGDCRVLNEAGVGGRMEREGPVHEGIEIGFEGGASIDLKSLMGKAVTLYGQTEMTRDLMDARAKHWRAVDLRSREWRCRTFQATDPRVTYRHDGKNDEIKCGFIAGCDGFHGVCRGPRHQARSGIRARLSVRLVRGPGRHAAGLERTHLYPPRPWFCTRPMRSPTRSRYYLQCSLAEDVDDWSDERFWEEFRRRIDDEADRVSVTVRHWRKASRRCAASWRSRCDSAACFSRAMPRISFRPPAPRTQSRGQRRALPYRRCATTTRRIPGGLDHYSGRALARIWKAERFSWWMTMLLHTFPNSAFEAKMQGRTRIYFKCAPPQSAGGELRGPAIKRQGAFCWSMIFSNLPTPAGDRRTAQGSQPDSC